MVGLLHVLFEQKYFKIRNYLIHEQTEVGERSAWRWEYSYVLSVSLIGISYVEKICLKITKIYQNRQLIRSYGESLAANFLSLVISIGIVLTQVTYFVTYIPNPYVSYISHTYRLPTTTNTSRDADIYVENLLR